MLAEEATMALWGRLRHAICQEIHPPRRDLQCCTSFAKICVNHCTPLEEDLDNPQGAPPLKSTDAPACSHAPILVHSMHPDDLGSGIPRSHQSRTFRRDPNELATDSMIGRRSQRETDTTGYWNPRPSPSANIDTPPHAFRQLKHPVSRRRLNAVNTFNCAKCIIRRAHHHLATIQPVERRAKLQFPFWDCRFHHPGRAMCSTRRDALVLWQTARSLPEGIRLGSTPRTVESNAMQLRSAPTISDLRRCSGGM
ncbi:hypothetical protein B0H13DRAFT_2457970 [Mycena leptocephala]|nr:hypothetical protein B0H13DRAFT_2457970 [Mycena leptocephala]